MAAQPVLDMELKRREDAPQSIDLAALAANPDVSVDKLERLVAMQERMMAVQAKAAFDDAFATMQGELPVIAERSKTDKAYYAALEDIVETVKPILAKHGFSLSYETTWPGNGIVRIVAILSHRQGHERRSEFQSPADSGPGRNAIQSLGSAMTYGRRYTLCDVLNIVSRKGEDDDGRKAGRVQEPDGYDVWLDTLATKADEGLPALQEMWRVAKEDATLRAYPAYLIKAEPGLWNELKTRAAKVKAVK